jgi:tetratricopeptide (TPR) repeat protein
VKMWDADEDMAHLDECDDCADYLDNFLNFVDVFGGRMDQFDLAIQELIDEELGDVPPERWAAEMSGNPEFRNSIIVEELQRRAIAARENPSVGLDLTAAAMAICEAMESEGEPPRAQLYFDVLKERAMMLRAANELDAAIETLSRASAKASELENREELDAVVWLCTALTYGEPDKGQFDEAIALAEQARIVFEQCGDQRRALMSRQTKAHALQGMLKFEEALDVALPLARAYEAIGAKYEAATAHHLIAHCYAALGTYDEAIGHALIAETGYEPTGNAVLIARASHVVARAIAGLGRFDEARTRFEEAAEIVWSAGLYDVWVLDKLDYVAAALHQDPFADVRGDVEAIARVCFMLGRENSTMRRHYAVEALDYLRQLSKRDELTPQAADYVRDFVARNSSQPPVRFRRPPSDELVM